MKKSQTLLTIAATATIMLASCSTDDGGGSPSSPTTSRSAIVPATTSPTATPMQVTVNCDIAPKSLVSSVLQEVPVEDQTTGTKDGRVWCYYRLGGAGSISVLMQTGVTPDQFDQSRNLVDGASNMVFTDLPGFEDRAFVGQNPHAPIPNNTVAGLRGSTAVLVTGTYASVDAEKRLVSTLLDRLAAAS